MENGIKHCYRWTNHCVCFIDHGVDHLVVDHLFDTNCSDAIAHDDSTTIASTDTDAHYYCYHDSIPGGDTVADTRADAVANTIANTVADSGNDTVANAKVRNCTDNNDNNGATNHSAKRTSAAGNAAANLATNTCTDTKTDTKTDACNVGTNTDTTDHCANYNHHSFADKLVSPGQRHFHANVAFDGSRANWPGIVAQT